MAREAIGSWGITEEVYSRTIPEPTTLTPQHKKDERVSLVDIGFNKVVRKNVTIPGLTTWLKKLN